jgi:hypothetical protein
MLLNVMSQREMENCVVTADTNYVRGGRTEHVVLEKTVK